MAKEKQSMHEITSQETETYFAVICGGIMEILPNQENYNDEQNPKMT